MLDKTRTLSVSLEETLNRFVEDLAPEVQQTVGGAFERLLALDVGKEALNVGEHAPNFSLPNLDGEMKRLSDYLANGPVVINFYRGGWCPFCNLEFKALMDALPEIQAHGATLVGISPELPDVSKETVKQHGIGFDVLSDVGNRVARQLGLIMPVDESLRPHYLNWGMDLVKLNGDDSWELPLPATYVIAKDGLVKAAYINKNYTQRMEPQEIIEALKRI